MENFDEYYRQYGLITIFLAIAISVPLGMMLLSWVFSLIGIRPSVPSSVKQSIYECGFETVTGTWERFNFRFYSFAILFVLFDVEAIFLFPWASQFGYLSKEFGLYILLEMLVFIGILFFGWLYAWKRGDLEWT